ncbi:juvenile hormone esterase-like [Cylas formicarius]|uniref:juvenile hormone esterase-like n=1 Tax=Cylas formicarius TaxID=197179 RepID=UPI00295885CD|nr:juvenile hormone esterase-like [Cylas formicarius]
MRRLLTVLFVSVALAADLIVDLPDGRIQGTVITNENKSYYAYRGIPFATPPLGKLRFQAPLPPQPWDGILETKESKDCCISMTENILQNGAQSEDCLYLNVYTPAREISEKLPVMLWIYGGGFLSGCAEDDTTGPYRFLDEDVIIVFANYRLGLYGFLSTEDDVVLGNAGLKDQLLVMKWIKNNIGLLGGDPDKLTIFGTSAGGISVGAHVVNTKAAGLFSGAICQSGCSLFYEGSINQVNARQAAYEYAKYVDPTISEKNTSTEILEFLQSVPAEVLTPAFNVNKQTGLVVEVEHEDAYITNLSFPVLESGNFNQVPLILGTSSAESLTFFAVLGGELLIRAMAAAYDENSVAILPADLVLLPGTNATEVVLMMKEAYVGPNGTFSENLAAVVDLSTDILFMKSTLKQAEMQSKFSPVYHYIFSFEGFESPLFPKIEGAGKAGHGEEGPYLFNSNPLVEDRDILLSKQIVRLWSNFAKTLNPTPDPTDPLFNLTWPQVTPTNIQYFDFDDQIAVRPNKKEKEMAMWNKVYYTYGQQPFIGF